MRHWKHDDARAALACFGLTGLNAQIAGYWLSLWSGDRPPLRTSFDPARVASHLASLAMIAVKPGEAVGMRLAGDNFRLATGIDLNGRDLLDFVPAARRAERVRNATDIVMGSVFRGTRRVAGPDGRFEACDEICLPFADPAEDGTRRYLVHTNWRPEHDGLTPALAAGTHCGIAEQIAFSPIERGA